MHAGMQTPCTVSLWMGSNGDWSDFDRGEDGCWCQTVCLNFTSCWSTGIFRRVQPTLADGQTGWKVSKDNGVSEPVYIKTNRKLCVLGLSFAVYAQRGCIDFWSDSTLMDVVMTTVGHLWTIWKAFLRAAICENSWVTLNVGVHRFSCNDIFIFNPD